MFYKLMSYSSQPVIFFLLFIGYYFISPLVVYFLFDSNQYLLMLSEVSIVAILGLLVGYFILSRFIWIKPAHLITIRGKYFVHSILFFFLIFILIVVLTADNIPLFLSFNSRDVYKLADAREHFFKARDGVQSLFVYVNAMLTTSILPYALVLSFVRSYDDRWFILITTYLFSLLFLEKAFFLKFILPFLSYCASAINQPNYKKYFIGILLLIPSTIYILTLLSGFGSKYVSEYEKAAQATKVVQATNVVQADVCSGFYRANYSLCVDTSPIHYIVWRVMAVPVFTASDSLRLFKTKYQEHLFFGKTSSFISYVLGMNRIRFEHEVFMSQWGDNETGTASANTSFFIEQFVNFGWFGVLLSSIFVGYLFSVLQRSSDIAFASLSIILSLSLLFGGLISTMLSGGFLVLFLLLYFVKLE